MVSPASGPLPSVSLIEPATLSRKSDGPAGTGVVVESVSVTSEPVGGVPWAVAVFATVPAFTSACVSAYVLSVHATVAPGASGPDGQLIAPPSFGSLTVTGFSVTLPVFFTVNE